MLEIVGFFLIGLLAIIQRRSKLHAMFFLFALTLGVWQLLQVLAIVTADYRSVAVALLMASVTFSAIMASSVYLFARAYAKKRTPYWIVIPATLIGLIAFFSKGLASVAITHKGLGIPQLDGYYAVVLVYDAAVLFLSILTLIFFYKKAKSTKERDQTKIILGSVAVGGIISIMASFYTTDFSNSLLAQQVIPVTCLIVLASFLYAMTYKSLFDIKLAAIRTLVYVLSLFTLAIIYYFLAYIVSITVFRNETNSPVTISPINISLALVLAFIFQPIKNFFDKITDTLFYHDRYNSDDFFARLSELLATTTELRDLLERAATEIGKTLKAEQAFFFVQYSKHHRITAGTPRHASIPPGDILTLNEYVKKDGKEKDVIVAELMADNHHIRRLLLSHRVAMVMPIVRNKTIIGYLALGEQRGSGYTNRDIKTLTTISDELVIAIQNALSVQEVKDININLQQRIDSATAELRTSNTQLRHLDKTKDEFLSMASHQLRTPLTSVKGYLSMVLEGDAGKISKTQKQLLSEAYASSERMVHLIHDFLNVSRLQTGKFILELHPYDIAKLVDEEVRSLGRAAEIRNMKLKFTNKVGEGLVLDIDENKIRQVVMNFIDNALFYSHDDSIILIDLTKNGDHVELRVKDTGIGVPKNEQAQLFTKFYRASNARKQRPDGTGVGIFLAKKVVTEHGGDVLFESVEGKGSMFGFTLPITKLLPSSHEELDKLNK